jgi:hypothetical protein
MASATLDPIQLLASSLFRIFFGLANQIAVSILYETQKKLVKCSDLMKSKQAQSATVKKTQLCEQIYQIQH